MFSFFFSFLIYSVIPLSQFSLSCDSWRLRRFFVLATTFLFTFFCCLCVFVFPPADDPRVCDRRPTSDRRPHVTLRLLAARPVSQLMLVMVSSVASDIFEWNNNHTRIRTVSLIHVLKTDTSASFFSFFSFASPHGICTFPQRTG